MSPDIAKAIARIAHLGQFYGREDYFAAHVTDVVNRVAQDPRGDPELVAVAWLHDVIEDTPASYEQLNGAGLTVRQHLALMSLTRWEREPYDIYIARVMANPDAMLVKLHDLESNIAAEPPIGKLCEYTGARLRILEQLERNAK